MDAKTRLCVRLGLKANHDAAQAGVRRVLRVRGLGNILDFQGEVAGRRHLNVQRQRLPGLS